MSCPHVRSIDLTPPRPSQSVYREDCTQCFDSIDDVPGLDVCLQCFNGGCAGERRHSLLHYQSTAHPLVLNIRRTRKHVHRDEPPPKLTKLAISAETEDDKYDTQATVNCHACQLQNVSQDAGRLREVVEGVLKAMTFAKQEEVKAWEQELTTCEHILCLQQTQSRQIASQDLGHCSSCDLKENLWLCLECGNLGCGRAQFGGVGGNGHGLAHTQDSGHAVAVKLGSITSEGSADIYCYKCDEERIDEDLPKHLAHWGIKIADREKTEKSLTELNIEQNLKWDFAMTTEDGRNLELLFGRGFAGLKNIGNSCYLASTVQCLFDLPEFQHRYFHPDDPPPSTNSPAEDLETQLRKLADGILSGRYSHPETTPYSSSEDAHESYQKGLNPAMFKHLVGRGHEEFSTMRQQDAFEFLLHLFKLVSVSNRSSPAQDPIQSFRFVMEQRLQCMSCKRVRLSSVEQDNISIPVPVRRRPVEEAQQRGAAVAKGSEFEAVSLKECLDIFTAVEKVEFSCPACDSKEGFLKSSKFKTFPQNLVINARRFELVNWVPTKLDVPVQVTDDAIDMSAYMSAGLQIGEQELAEDDDISGSATGPSSFVPNEVALEQLEAMGMPRVRAEKALHATGNSDAETALTWLLEHSEDSDIDEPLNLTSGSRGAAVSVDSEKISQLADMGIGISQARKALRECDGDMARAVDWVFSHPDDSGDVEDEPPARSAETRAPPGSTELPALFELESIACHKGASIHAGHYVAFVRKRIPGQGEQKQWVLYNDEKVVKAEDVDELKKFAYVYFFRRGP